MLNRTQAASPPTRVVYLCGAGATQAELDYRGGPVINLLMRDNKETGEGIAARIFSDLPETYQSFRADGGTDIEKLTRSPAPLPRLPNPVGHH